MNGWLAVAHSNLYTLSTLGGTVHNAQGPDEEQLKRNLNMATDVYIFRVQGASFSRRKNSFEGEKSL